MADKQGSLNLVKLDLVSADGSKRKDLRGTYNVLQIDQSIFENFMSGSVDMVDAESIRDFVPIIGEETLEVEFFTVTPDNSDIETTFSRTFRVYSYRDGVQIVNSAATGYRLYFVADELIKNESSLLKRIYKNKTVKQIAEDIFLGLESKRKLEVEETVGIQNIVISSKKPVQALNLLTTYSISPSSIGSLYTFYETTSGFYFKNIETLYDAESKQKYRTNVFQVENDAQNDLLLITDFKIIQGFDHLKAVSDGMYSNTVYSIDLLTRTYKKKSYNYKSDYSKTKHIEMGVPFLGKDTANPASYHEKLLTTKSSRQASSYIKANDTSQSFKKGVEEILPYRLSMMRQLENQVLQITIYGNTELEAGHIIELEVPPNTYSREQDIEQLDQNYSGRWLITSLIHTINQDRHHCILTLSKDVFKRAPKES